MNDILHNDANNRDHDSKLLFFRSYLNHIPFHQIWHSLIGKNESFQLISFYCTEGKTDYYARKRLIAQAKNKYNTPKYRFVVRITNRDVICQFVYARLQGDIVLSAAYAHELPRYGVKVGLTNWAACYATGLLAARRVLKQLKLDETYAGNDDINGEYYCVEPVEEGPRPFKAFMDVGLRRTTTGSRIFACLKGAVDGGVEVPHSESRFPGYSKDSKELDVEMLRGYIFGEHVSDYMEYLKEEDDEVYKKQFASFIAEGITAEDLEDMYTEAHEAIRADPSAVKKERAPLTAEQKHKLKYSRAQKRNLKQRNDRVKQRKEAYLRALAAQE